jgi:hypothetical protein
MNEMWKLGVLTAIEKLALKASTIASAASKRFPGMPVDVYKRLVLSRHSSPRLRRRAKELAEKIRRGASAGAYEMGPRIRGGGSATAPYARIFHGGAVGSARGGR